MKQSLSRFCMTLVASALAGLAGCSMTEVIYADQDLPPDIEVGTPHLERLPDSNLLTAIVPVHNRSEETRQLMVQVEFYDRDKIPYGDVTPKQLVIVSRGGTVNHQVTSMKSRAHYVHVRVWRYESR